MLRIGPFNYDPLRGVDLWLEQSDDFILQHLSTTPAVEPPHFVHHVSMNRELSFEAMYMDYSGVTSIHILGQPGASYATISCLKICERSSVTFH